MSQAVVGAVVGVLSSGVSYAGSRTYANEVQRRAHVALGRIWRQGKANVPAPEGATSLDVTFDVFDEFDTGYLAIVTPQWNTSVWVTNKTTKGFRLNFGTGAPAGGSALDWATFRFFPETMKTLRDALKAMGLEDWVGEWK
jgi:hypothetical protein